MITLDSARDKDYRDKKFLASMQGVNLDEEKEEPSDVSDLMNIKTAKDEGFGVGEGLGFLQL